MASAAQLTATVNALMAELPDGFRGRVVFHVGGNGSVKVELSRFFKVDSDEPTSDTCLREPVTAD